MNPQLGPISLRLPVTIGMLLAILLPSLGAANPIRQNRSLTAAVAPQPTSPTEGQVLGSFGPILRWENSSGATQVHLQVIPVNNDGPGIDAYVGSAITSFAIPPPPLWYGLLPDMAYTWRLQVSDALTSVPLDDQSWSPWVEQHFRTPVVSSDNLTLTTPSNGATVGSRTPVLQWANSRSDVFYYEVQVSKDPGFNTDPATATTTVYWELRHGGVTNPLNSYTAPSGFPLDDNATYYWRVRPRVQGDGTPALWSWPSSFHVNLAAQPVPTATPTPSPLPTFTPTPTATPTPPSGPPALSGERLAFVSARDGPGEIWVVRPDGTGLFNLTKKGFTNDKPAWSKDGSKLAFVSDRDGNREIYSMNADGSNQFRITNNAALDDDPNWSPDGSKIAFISRRDVGIGQQIYVVKADGVGATRLTNSTAANWNPLWSPDGTKVLYGSSRNSNLDIFVSTPDGAGEVNITDNAAVEFDHAWSSDGKKILFSSNRDGNFEIYSMNADGTNSTDLTHTASNESMPAPSPDGSKIAYVSDAGGHSQVYVMNADGTGQRNVSNSTSDDTGPVWSPDGSKLAFVSKRTGHKEVFVVKPDGSGLAQVTSSPDDDYHPAWAPK